jgi:hypothetical protein
MKLRIGIWAAVGALVVALWTLYISVSKPTSLGNIWILADLTCPISLVRNHALSFYFVLLVNAATYALIGMIVEIMRRFFKHSRTI